VLVPEIEEAPAPIVRTELFAALAVKVRVPVLTVRAVESVALVTADAVVAVVAVAALPPMFKALAVPVKLVATPEAGVPSAPPETRMLEPSIERTPAETRARVVSDAWPISSEPTPRAVDVEATSPAIGRPVALVRVPDDGVPSAPPETKLPEAVPVNAPTNVVAFTVFAKVALWSAPKVRAVVAALPAVVVFNMRVLLAPVPEVMIIFEAPPVISVTAESDPVTFAVPSKPCPQIVLEV
jgi:hypothetical protein